MKSNKICSKLRKGANFAAANLPLRPQKKNTMTAYNDKSQLSESAMHFLYTPATSVPSERLFSKARDAGFPSEELSQTQYY